MMASAHNLTNLSTYGFKKERVLPADMFYTTMKQAGAMADQSNQMPTGLQIGTGARVMATQKLFTSGNIQSTSSPLDMAVAGKGFFQVLKSDGEIAYTRNGQLQLNAEGTVVMASGLPLEPAIQIPMEHTDITVNAGGAVFVTVPGESAPQQVGQVVLANFINPTGLKAIGDHLHVETAASGEPAEGTAGQDGLGEIRQYALESSNVDMIEELVSFIMIQRGYEMQAKAIKTSHEAREFLVRQS